MNSIIFIVVCTFVWVGFIAAISFMESWLKFRAPNVTLTVGLSIGKLVFSALNKVEWAFAIIIGINLLFFGSAIKPLFGDWFFAIFIIIVLQTVWLLPALNKRAEALISGKRLVFHSFGIYQTFIIDSFWQRSSKNNGYMIAIKGRFK
jgi:hypothetical protein